jgi:hypothetical protein
MGQLEGNNLLEDIIGERCGAVGNGELTTLQSASVDRHPPIAPLPQPGKRGRKRKADSVVIDPSLVSSPSNAQNEVLDQPFEKKARYPSAGGGLDGTTENCVLTTSSSSANLSSMMETEEGSVLPSDEVATSNAPVSVNAGPVSSRGNNVVSSFGPFPYKRPYISNISFGAADVLYALLLELRKVEESFLLLDSSIFQLELQHKGDQRQCNLLTLLWSTVMGKRLDEVEIPDLSIHLGRSATTVSSLSPIFHMF